ncbi:putative ADP-ribosylation factor GTPase-activating protein AGD11-like [Heracleum sosnowskyi]|uniref:ADP-ribosylation factor GTPase-activating protein AGD11-like n=1 Tax=Heracleum sosnowskyi TaxID=360622 RepID=A0AAD8I7M8_9APIA|nr:putative ADP-ribosylation factor GTPase-activating protein AGD11-like [Heracleum sosnowskyi]
MLLPKQKKNQASQGNRILISVTVIGSAGPIRLVVNTEELVVTAMDSILKSYARVGRLPILGTNTNNFYLSAGCDALHPSETIGSHGVWNFLLWKKPEVEKLIGTDKPVSGGMPLLSKGRILSRKQGHANWRAWFSKSKSLKITSH